MNITLLTHYVPTPKENYQLIADLTIPTKDEYCARFGYRHLIHGGSYGNERLYWAIQRLQLIYDYLFAAVNDVDAVWALNPQSLITSLKIDVAKYLTPEHDFFITADINGLNAGSFIIRKTEWSKKWLKMLIKQASETQDCWYEQRQMQNHYKDAEWAPKINILDHPSIQCYDYKLYGRGSDTPGHWRKGSLVLSLPGTTFEHRVAYITNFLADNKIDY
jgi:hypothetical protein